jgi:enolase-phosphatase E1
MIKAVVTDIEGTTTSLSFVKDVLFPYARNNMPTFLSQHWQDDNIQRLQQQIEQEAGRTLDLQETVLQCQQWIDEDRKITPLKTLQGIMWKSGYEKGDFKSHVYADAVDKLRHWHNAGVRLYVYSSGSIRAQQLLFSHTDYGDLSPLFDGYFDTTTGSKREVTSYQHIAACLQLAPGEILFLSDMAYELDAARAAGMQVIMLCRDGQDDTGYASVPDFSRIDINHME